MLAYGLQKSAKCMHSVIPNRAANGLMNNEGVNKWIALIKEAQPNDIWSMYTL